MGKGMARPYILEDGKGTNRERIPTKGKNMDEIT